MGGEDRVNRPIFSCIVKHGSREIPIYGMYDSGCTSAILLTSISEDLHIHTSPRHCRLSTFDKNRVEVREFASFEVMSTDRSTRFTVKDALVGEVLTTEDDNPPRNNDVTPYRYLDGVVFDELESDLVGIILGAPFAWLWMEGDTKFHSPELPLAKKSRLGWLLIGPSLAGKDSMKSVDIGAIDMQSLNLYQAVKRMHRQDFISPGPEVHSEIVHPSRQDDYALKQMQDSVTQDLSTGRYTVGLPWRHG